MIRPNRQIATNENKLLERIEKAILLVIWRRLRGGIGTEGDQNNT